MYRPKYQNPYIAYTDYNIFRWHNMSSSEAVSGPVEIAIRTKLETGLKPQHCDIINESYMHNAPKGSESHFKVVVISEKFDKQPLIKVDIIKNLFLIHQTLLSQFYQIWKIIYIIGENGIPIL